MLPLPVGLWLESWAAAGFMGWRQCGDYLCADRLIMQYVSVFSYKVVDEGRRRKEEEEEKATLLGIRQLLVKR